MNGPMHEYEDLHSDDVKAAFGQHCCRDHDPQSFGPDRGSVVVAWKMLLRMLIAL